jgi:hypothetical protein
MVERAKRRQYARDFSELTHEDLVALANAMARIGLKAAEKARQQAAKALVRPTQEPQHE